MSICLVVSLYIFQSTSMLIVPQPAGWINEKLKFATDDSYLDPTNLNGKVQKHQNFEQELHANKPRVDEIATLGSQLLSQEHFAQRTYCICT